MTFTLTEDKTLSYFVYQAVKKTHPCVSPILVHTPASSKITEEATFLLRKMRCASRDSTNQNALFVQGCIW